MNHFSILIIFFSFSIIKAFHKNLTKIELTQVFGIDSQADVPEYTFVNTTQNLSNDGTLLLSFHAWNSFYQLKLEPNKKLISPHLISVIRDGNKIDAKQGLPANMRHDCYFRGKVISHGNISAAISNCKSLTGTIVMDDHFLVLQQIPSRLIKNTNEQHILYKRQASLLTPLEREFESKFYEYVNDQNGEFCDVSKSIDGFETKNDDNVMGPIIFNYSVPTEGKLDSLFIFPQLDPLTLEIGLFLDSKLYEHFEREYVNDAEQHLIDFSLALINNVHVLYQQSSMSPNLDIVIVRYELWKKQPTGLDTLAHRNGQAQTLLNLFCHHQASINPGTDLTDPGHWDHAILLTGYDIYHTTTSVAGVAPVARMCNHIYACSLVEGLHLGRSFVLAHEMGHNMGMVHDGVQNQCSKGCCLMAAVNGAGKTTWSACSVRELNAFLLHLDNSGVGNCLRDSAENLATYDHLKDGRLPGQRFTADQQCSYFWGKDYQVEIPNGKSMNDICRILWCGNNGSTISTAHPALEGSWCGSEKFCIEGQCREWPYDDPPLPIDGGWSDWSSRERRCPIFQCLITRSVYVLSQMRTCTNPAHNNGGRKCLGSKVRGLLCGNPISHCKAISRAEYGAKVCKAALDDPEKPDRQLTGTTFLHSTQPCKIWCHLINSESVRNKGLYPDGSPCGANKFCIGGYCLTLACNNTALVEDPADCPGSKSPNQWSNWSEWSECSKPCEKDGIQERKRTCEQESCEGLEKEKRPCISTLEDCMSWTEWSSCSVSCGSGIKRRMKCDRRGDCSAEDEQLQNCDEECEKGTWSEWHPCTASCGIGFQIRERLCGDVPCLPIQKQAKTCSAKECSSSALTIYSWENWSDWSPCSTSCGEGVQIRKRKCISGICPTIDMEEDSRRCVLRPCPQWTEWGDWSPCKHCSSNSSRYRRRKCEEGVVRFGEDNSDCYGESLQAESCESFCKIQERNEKDLTIKVEGGTESRRSPISTKDKIAWDSWQEWQRCSATCGNGIRLRVRICQSGQFCGGKAMDFGLETCNIVPCDEETRFSLWSEWSECSKSCGQGVKRRDRVCSGTSCNGKSYEENSCANWECPNEKARNIIISEELFDETKPRWSEWSSWSECSCHAMNKYRRRYCQIIDPLIQGFCVGPVIQQKACVPFSCASKNGEWSNWGEWSKCSQTCGSFGHRLRNRMCSDPIPTNRGSYCIGYSFDQEICEPLVPCENSAINGQWTTWTDWSPCSQRCGNGQRSRTRFCANPVPKNGGLPCIGKDFELISCTGDAPCINSVDGGWSGWTSWTLCSSNCGFALQSRYRICNNPIPQFSGKPCFGLAYMTTLCKTKICEDSIDGLWSHWNEWSACSGTCGKRMRTRRRECNSPSNSNGGYPCFGRSSEMSECEFKSDLNPSQMCLNTIANVQQIDAIN